MALFNDSEMYGLILIVSREFPVRKGNIHIRKREGRRARQRRRGSGCLGHYRYSAAGHGRRLRVRYGLEFAADFCLRVSSHGYLFVVVTGCGRDVELVF